MNNLLRPALYGAIHNICPVTLKEDKKKISYDVVGPVCESSDIFIKDIKASRSFKRRSNRYLLNGSLQFMYGL